jgi:peptidoglycan/xylan/chitin deacetylase (PgdA/CDA1 family)
VALSTLPGGRTLAILGFHKIGDPPPGGWETWFYIPEATFVGYLRHLRDAGRRVIDLRALLRGLVAPETLPERAAVLTFDDGYRSLLDVALPRLRAFGYPAVVFVPTGFIGGRNAFDADEEPDEAICDWGDLRALERAGVAVQSHGVSHRALTRLSPAELDQELGRSKAELEAGLSRTVEAFAYPYGDGGTGRRWRHKRAEVRDALRRAGYRAACLYGGGVNRLPVGDAFRLARVAMGPDTDLGRELDGPEASQAA